MKANETRGSCPTTSSRRSWPSSTEERFRLRFRSATEAIENPMRFRALRRDIARIKTVLREQARARHERMTE